VNSTPVPRNAAHGAALEQYRLAQVTLDRFVNVENVSNGRGMSWLQLQSQYQALVDARDAALAKVERVNPAAKAKR